MVCCSYTYSCVNYTAALLDNKSKFRMTDKWLTLLGLNPRMSRVDGTTDFYVFCKVDTQTSSHCSRARYDNINIHSSITKSVYASISGVNQIYVTPTNIFWAIQIVSEPSP